MRCWRRDLHQIPEPGLQRYRTNDDLAAELEAMGLQVARSIGGTSLVATLRRANGPSGTSCFHPQRLRGRSPIDEAVDLRLKLAAGDVDKVEVAAWLTDLPVPLDSA